MNESIAGWIAPLDDIPVNGNRVFTAGGREVLVVRTSAGTFAVENMCSHQQQKLEGGKVKAVHIFCPAHGVRFDMRNGCPTGNLTKKPIKVWPVSIEDGWVVVDFDSA